MRILVTGGAGFIGSHVCEYLLKDGHRVSILDDLNDFYPRAMKIQNLMELRSAATFYHGDICNQQIVERIFEQELPEAVIHLAARAGVRPSIQQPMLYERVNVAGTTLLLEIARQFDVQKFVFASSSSIYGVADRVPFSEDDTQNLPISPYAATKIAGEKICYTYSHLYKLKTVCLRLFTVYGPRQRPDLAIRKFADMIQKGQPIPVFGDGTSSRDYTFIDDIVGGIVAALHHDSRFDIFNLGNSQPVQLRTLIKSLELNLGSRATLVHEPAQPGDVPITFADISKARRLLGYKPQTPFDEGIEKFVEWQLATSRAGVRHAWA
jgi:UDP-glucuronate 4-epimerase